MLERKGFGIRLAAYLIDGIIIGIVWQVLWRAIFQPSVADLLASNEDVFEWARRVNGRYQLIMGLLGLALAGVEIGLAQTPGKMILKLRVQGETGAPATKEQLIRRSALKYGVYVFYVIGGLLAMPWITYIGFLPALAFLVGAFFTLQPSKQGLHDQLGKTAVFGPATAMVPGFQPMMGGQPPMPGQPYPPQQYGGQPMPPQPGMQPPPPYGQPPMQPPPPQA